MGMGTKAAAKVAGKAKGAMKAMAGYPKIFHHLAAEHGEVAALMQRVAGSSDPKVRAEVFEEVRKNLLAHAHAEEAEFYPQLRSRDGLDPLVAQCLDEHRQVETELAALASDDMSTDQWGQRFERMMHAVEAHVEREENELFPKAKDLVGSDEAKQIYDRYENAEDREKGRLSH